MKKTLVMFRLNAFYLRILRPLLYKFLGGFCLILIPFLSMATEQGVDLLVISDVDDTIKVTHVHDNKDALRNGLFGNEYFLGANQVLTYLASLSNTRLVYLSNAPLILYNRYFSFLDQNQFLLKPPEITKVDLRPPFEDAKSNKIKKILNYVDTYHPKWILLIGDNGEADPEIYHTATKEIEKLQIRTTTFIHQVYAGNEIPKSGRIHSHQRPYVFPIEILMSLKSEGLNLKSEDILRIGNEFIEQIEGRRPHPSPAVAFATWQRCDIYPIGNGMNFQSFQDEGFSDTESVSWASNGDSIFRGLSWEADTISTEFMYDFEKKMGDLIRSYCH